MMDIIVGALTSLAEYGAQGIPGRFDHRSADFELAGWPGPKHEVFFIPAGPQTTLSGAASGEYVFHFAENANGRLAMALKLFSNAREMKFREIGFDVLGEVVKNDDTFLLIQQECRYPFSLDILRLICLSCGLDTEYDEPFLLEVEKVKVYMKELMEAK